MSESTSNGGREQVDTKENLRIIRRLFRRYYAEKFDLPEWVLDPINQREFGFMFFTGGIQRHVGVTSVISVKEILKNRVPKNAYYSTACYMHPDAEDMDLKVWRCADISFDIDVDHIPTKCKLEHDHWVCEDCGYEGRGTRPLRCPKCESERIKQFTWICDNCLEEAKEQVLRLIDDFLLGDFGFSPEDLIINFSGHRGYHVRVTSKAYSSLDTKARGMLVEYILGMGVKDMVLREVTYKKRFRGYSFGDYGWRGRVARGLYEIISSYSHDQFIEMGIGNKGAEFLVNERNGLLRAMEISHPNWMFVKEIGVKDFELLLERVIASRSVVIDERVTKDVKRLMRIPNTLHGSTGLKATLLSYSAVEAFDPKEEASVLGDDELKVVVTDKHVFRVTVSGYLFDPGQIPLNKPVWLPIPVAVYLVLRGHAYIVGE